MTSQPASAFDLTAWQHAQKSTFALADGRHTIHSYFNTCPESPDGKFVVFYTSTEANGEKGVIRILERATGKETVIAADIITEDAHRAACQQWVNNGKTVLYHNCRDGRWEVVAVDVATLKATVLAQDRQLGFGSPTQPWAPVYGCHWNPGEHRNLELIDVVTGETRTPVTVERVLQKYPEWTQGQFGTSDLSIFFPVLSPDGQRVFFKLSRPSGGSDFRSPQASTREGKIVYDLGKGDFMRLFSGWGHPSWAPDSKHIFEKGNVLFDLIKDTSQRYAPSAISDHPSVSPRGDQFVTDGTHSRRPDGQQNENAVVVGSMREDKSVVVDRFDNSRGATSWRHNHPHPVFSADGRRIYYNVNDGPWTRLMVAEIPSGAAK